MKSKKTQTRIMVFGTFDVLHAGHLNFFRQARSLAKNPFLIVSVARDINVKKIKGRKPLLPEKKRLKLIKQIPLVQKAVLGEKTAYLKHILTQKPEIIALGYDQKAYTKNLGPILKKNGLQVEIRRLKPHKPSVYKSSLLKQKNAII